MVIVDDLGRKVELPQPVRSIVSLAPAISENLFAMGASSVLVGVSTADDYPLSVQELPPVGDFGKPSYERIRSLKPDLVMVEIADIDLATIKNAERRLDIPVFVQSSKKYDDVTRHLNQLGDITGIRGKALGTSIQKMESAKKEAARIAAGRKQLPSVFIEVSRSPLWTVGPGSFLEDLIRLAGGVNIVKSGRPFLPYSREALLSAQPDIYIVASNDPVRANVKLTPPLDRIPAARSGKVIALPADYLFRPTPRLAEGLVLLARALR
jgi:iron complex transport system substrate-binding protein